MDKYTFRQFINDVLSSSSKPLTFMEIWQSGVEKGLHKRLNSIGKTPWQNIAALLYMDIKNKDSIFYIYSKQPTTFYIKNQNIVESIKSYKEIPVNKQLKYNKKERDLHPLLVEFLYHHLNLYCKTIYHEKSIKGKNGQDKWIHPEIVGVYFPFIQNYEKETLSFLKHNYKFSFKLYAFELKVKIHWNNLKESYFQAVSNSSFANEGYLVIFDDFDDEILEELRRLNSCFGIGVIKLEENVFNSKILIPSHKRELDVKTIDMLVSKNKNFRDFIKAINSDLEIGEEDRIVKKNYDQISSLN